MPTLTQVQKRVSEVLEATFVDFKDQPIRVLSEDKIEGVDSLRSVFVVTTALIDQSPHTKNFATNDVEVEIYYFGESTADCKSAADRLNQIFCNPLKIDDVVVVPQEHTADVGNKRVLMYTFTLSYITAINNQYSHITLGDIPHITEHSTEKMGEVHITKQEG